MSFFSNASAEARPFPQSLDLSSIMRQVYLWLALGLMAGFGVAFAVGSWAINTPNSFIFQPGTALILSIVYLIAGFALYPIAMRAKPVVAGMFYLFVTVLFGLMVSGIIGFAIEFRPGALLAAFGSTAAMFAAMSIIGYTTKVDLSRFGSILMMALIGLIVASLINLFLRSEAIFWIISYAGVLIFAGLTAYDTQWIKNNAAQIAEMGDADMAQRIAIIGAFHLFLDFVNLFIYLLSIFLNSSRE